MVSIGPAISYTRSMPVRTAQMCWRPSGSITPLMGAIVLVAITVMAGLPAHAEEQASLRIGATVSPSCRIQISVRAGGSESMLQIQCGRPALRAMRLRIPGSDHVGRVPLASTVGTIGAAAFELGRSGGFTLASRAVDAAPRGARVVTLDF